MKIVRPALAAFMMFFCVVSAIPLMREFKEAVHRFGDPGADTSPILGALVARLLVCLFFAGLTFALWKKSRRSTDQPPPSP